MVSFEHGFETDHLKHVHLFRWMDLLQKDWYINFYVQEIIENLVE